MISCDEHHSTYAKKVIIRDHLILGGIEMLEELEIEFADLYANRDEAAIQALSSGLRGDFTLLEPHVEANLRECGAMALNYGRRMGMKTQDAFDALAAICLVLGDSRVVFFENVFLNRMMVNQKLTPTEKLNRILEIVVRTIPRSAPYASNDNIIRESA